MSTSRFSIPILSRELIESAARRRTFILRTLFAAVFLGFVFLAQAERFRRSGSAVFDVLGSGQWLFQDLVAWQIGAVVVMMPLITCGTIVNEKQRDTLTLLLTTRTTPFGIIVQKLVSRVCLMLTLLLVSLPLAAFAYSLGGVEIEAIIVQVVCVTVLTVTLGSLAIMWSVICSSAAGAFIATLLTGLLLALPGACVVAGAAMMASEVMLVPLIAMLPCMFFIAIASDRLRESAMRPPKNHLVLLFRTVDRIFDRLNHITGGIRLTRPRNTLPRNAPITWRETEKKALGQPQHLVRVMLLLEIPTIVILTIALFGNPRAASTGLSFLVALLWMMSIGLIIVRTSGLIAAERTRQTLDVLLTTPLSGRSILKQYAAGSRRLMLALSVPFATIFLARLAVNGVTPVVILYVVTSALTIVIYMPLCAWITLWLGLRSRTQMGTLIGTLLIVLGWIFLPEFADLRRESLSLFASPSTLVLAMEQKTFFERSTPINEAGLLIVGASLAFYAGILAFVRWRCLATADARFDRCQSTPATRIHESLASTHSSLS